MKEFTTKEVRACALEQATTVSLSLMDLPFLSVLNELTKVNKHVSGMAGSSTTFIQKRYSSAMCHVIRIVVVLWQAWRIHEDPTVRTDDDSF